MLRAETKKLSAERLKDAEVLLNNRRYEGAVYICGYAIELGLKNQICKKLEWKEYPPGKGKGSYRSFKTHDLDILLSLTGKERLIKDKYLAEWSVVAEWTSEMRYDADAKAKISKKNAQIMIESTKTLLKLL